MIPLNMLEKATTRKIVDNPILNDLYFLYMSFIMYYIIVINVPKVSYCFIESSFS